jgi:transposase
MDSYSKTAMERAKKVQEVILRAFAKKITWSQAAEIIGISDRQMRRWRERYEEFGYDGLFDRRRGKPSPKRVPVAMVEQVLGLYREKYFDFNVLHFQEKLRAEHGLRLSYTWVKQALQGDPYDEQQYDLLLKTAIPPENITARPAPANHAPPVRGFCRTNTPGGV